MKRGKVKNREKHFDFFSGYPEKKSKCFA